MVSRNKEKTFITISVLILVIIVISGLTYAFYFAENGPDEPVFTSTYVNITPVQAYDLINKSNNTDYNLSVVDCRGLEGCSTCQFNHGHLPGAVLNSNYETLYNSTNDILVYSRDGTLGASFCENLTGSVYGKIYNLDGGYYAWSSYPNFPTTG